MLSWKVIAWIVITLVGIMASDYSAVEPRITVFHFSGMVIIVACPIWLWVHLRKLGCPLRIRIFAEAVLSAPYSRPTSFFSFQI
jgi:hypothetical protein